MCKKKILKFDTVHQMLSTKLAKILAATAAAAGGAFGLYHARKGPAAEESEAVDNYFEKTSSSGGAEARKKPAKKVELEDAEMAGARGRKGVQDVSRTEGEHGEGGRGGGEPKRGSCPCSSTEDGESGAGASAGGASASSSDPKPVENRKEDGSYTALRSSRGKQGADATTWPWGRGKTSEGEQEQEEGQGSLSLAERALAKVPGGAAEHRQWHGAIDMFSPTAIDRRGMALEHFHTDEKDHDDDHGGEEGK